MYLFKTEGMSCGHCISTVTKAVKELDSKAQVKVDLDAQTISVASEHPVDEIAHAIDEAGYPVLERKTA